MRPTKFLFVNITKNIKILKTVVASHMVYTPVNKRFFCAHIQEESVSGTCSIVHVLRHWSVPVCVHTCSCAV